MGGYLESNLKKKRDISNYERAKRRVDLKCVRMNIFLHHAPCSAFSYGNSSTFRCTTVREGIASIDMIMGVQLRDPPETRRVLSLSIWYRGA